MSQIAPIQVALFDFGGVVVPVATAETMARLEHELALAPGNLQALMYEGDLWPELSVGRLTDQEYWRGLGELVGRGAGELQELLREVWTPHSVDHGVIEIVQSLRRRMKVALLSNATRDLEGQLAALGIAHLFTPVINSARVGLRKPDPEVFRHALRVLDVPAPSILFIDDKERNTRVAEELGIPSVVFETSAQLAGTLRSRGLLPAPGAAADSQHILSSME